MRHLVITASLALVACSRGTSAPPDMGVVDARSLLEVALDARMRLAVPRFRAQLRVEIADALARAGKIDDGHHELAGAIGDVQELTDASDRDRALVRVGRSYLLLGDEPGARAILERIKGGEDRAELLAELVDDIPSALALTASHDRDRALARLAMAAVAASDLDRAGQAAARIEDGSVRAPVTGAIITLMLRVGRSVDTKRTIAQLEGLARSEAEAALALDAGRRGDVRAARRWADGIESELIRTRTLARLAMGHAPGSAERKRSMAEAIQVALDIQSSELRHSAIEALAAAMVEAGDPLGADTVMGTALAAPVRSKPGLTALDAAGARRVRVIVAQGYAAQRDTASAARVAGAIDDPVLAADAWAAVARASLAANLPEAALAAAARMVPDELRLPVIAEIAVAPGLTPTPELRAALTSALARAP